MRREGGKVVGRGLRRHVRPLVDASLPCVKRYGPPDWIDLRAYAFLPSSPVTLTVGGDGDRRRIRPGNSGQRGRQDRVDCGGSEIHRIASTGTSMGWGKRTSDKSGADPLLVGPAPHLPCNGIGRRRGARRKTWI